MIEQRKVPVAEATVPQLTAWLKLHELDQPAAATREELINAVTLAQLPSYVIVSETTGAEAPEATDLDELFAEPLDFDLERWMRIRFDEDSNAEDKESVIQVGYDSDVVNLRRQRQLCVRERFVRVLNDSKEVHVVQPRNDGTGKFSEARQYLRHRHPFTFLGVAGLVKDGIPDLPDDVIVYTQ